MGFVAIALFAERLKNKAPQQFLNFLPVASHFSFLEIFSFKLPDNKQPSTKFLSEAESSLFCSSGLSSETSRFDKNSIKFSLILFNNP